jgi:hypothetical protein
MGVGEGQPIKRLGTAALTTGRSDPDYRRTDSPISNKDCTDSRHTRAPIASMQRWSRGGAAPTPSLVRLHFTFM